MGKGIGDNKHTQLGLGTTGRISKIITGDKQNQDEPGTRGEDKPTVAK